MYVHGLDMSADVYMMCIYDVCGSSVGVYTDLYMRYMHPGIYIRMYMSADVHSMYIFARYIRMYIRAYIRMYTCAYIQTYMSYMHPGVEMRRWSRGRSVFWISVLSVCYVCACVRVCLCACMRARARRMCMCDVSVCMHVFDIGAYVYVCCECVYVYTCYRRTQATRRRKRPTIEVKKTYNRGKRDL